MLLHEREVASGRDGNDKRMAPRELRAPHSLSLASARGRQAGGPVVHGHVASQRLAFAFPSTWGPAHRTVSSTFSDSDCMLTQIGYLLIILDRLR